MKPLSKDAKGLIKFIIIFSAILLSGLVADKLNTMFFAYLIKHNIVYGLAGLFIGMGLILYYEVPQLIMVYVLAMKMLNNTNNKYLKKIFIPFDNSVKILLTLFIFDATINLFIQNKFDLSSYDNSDIKYYLFFYNLYLAPSVKFLVIFLLACFNKLKPAKPEEE